MFFQQSYLQRLATPRTSSEGQNGEAFVFGPDATVPSVPRDVLSTQNAGPGTR